MSVIVLQMSNETVHDVIDGRLYSVPHGEPFEFASTFIGRKFIEHKHWWGVVEVRTTRTRSGISFEIEEAMERANQLLLQKDQEVIQNYINTQYDDRLAHGKPALKPGGRAAMIMAKHGINLASYGIRPVGTLEGNLAAGTTQADPGLTAQVQTLQKMVMALLSGQTLSESEKATIAREMASSPVPADVTLAGKSELHPAPEVRITDEKEIESSLGGATDESGSLPNDPAQDGVVDFGRSYAQLGTAPGVEDLPPNDGPQAGVSGNMRPAEVVSTLGQVEIKPPASKTRNRG